MLTRSLRCFALVALAGTAAFARPAAAQSADPVDDLINKVIADVNDLRYADAIRRGNEVLTFTRTMRPTQQALLRTALAAAFYPEETAAQQPDSAIAQFVAGLKVLPDLTLPIELRWAGLDSLLAVARTRTLAVTVTMDDQAIVGPDGRAGISVQSSRPARFLLRTNSLGAAAVSRQDSTRAAATSATLRLRAHDGRDVLLATGEYVATIVAIDVATRDSVVVTRRMQVEGAALMLVAPAALDSTKLRPESATRPPMLKTALTALAFGTATFIFGSLSGGEGDFAEDVEPDGRGAIVGLAIFGAGISTYWLDKGKADPAVVAANNAVRDEHRRAVDAAEAENARRIRAYRVNVTFAPEAR